VIYIHDIIIETSAYKLNQTVRKYNLNISSKKTKVTVFAGAEPVTAKIIVDGKIIEQISSSKYLYCEKSYRNKRDVESIDSI